MTKQLNELSKVELLNTITAAVEELTSRENAVTKYVEREIPSTVEEVEHDGKLLRKVERKCKVGDYVRVQHKNGDFFKPNKFYGPVLNGRVMADSSTGYAEYEKASVYNEMYGRNLHTVEVFEVVSAAPQIIKSPNQQRAELIQRAREFVEDLKRPGEESSRHWEYREFPYKDSGYGLVLGWRGSGCAYNVEFIVNQEKRTVEALLRGYVKGEVECSGIAKCMPGNVFNESIGKAIALAKALKIDIPQEFMDAVQPNKKVIGMVVMYGDTPVKLTDKGPWGWKEHGTAMLGSVVGSVSTIIDDTNATYESVGE